METTAVVIEVATAALAPGKVVQKKRPYIKERDHRSLKGNVPLELPFNPFFRIQLFKFFYQIGDLFRTKTGNRIALSLLTEPDEEEKVLLEGCRGASWMGKIGELAFPTLEKGQLLLCRGPSTIPSDYRIVGKMVDGRSGTYRIRPLGASPESPLLCLAGRGRGAVVLDLLPIKEKQLAEWSDKKMKVSFSLDGVKMEVTAFDLQRLIGSKMFQPPTAAEPPPAAAAGSNP